MGVECERDSQKKSPGWYTAFYRYAEYLRLLTNGAINHKSLYAYAGMHGKYVNSQNPTQRKRCAASLSRLLHSSRYAADFQENLQQNPDAFYEAAALLSKDMQRETTFDRQTLVQFLLDEGYAQLRAGLIAEISDGRMDVQISRLDAEMELLRAWVREQCDQSPSHADACLRAVLRSFFHVMTFGHVEEHFANRLVDANPTDVLEEKNAADQPVSLRACVMRSVDGNPASIENMWAIGQEGIFLIGRYVDCDAVETNGLVSRRHCCIFRLGDCWYVRDEGSRYGTAVHRGARTVWSSKHAASREAFPLAFGDCLVLAGHVHYWLVSLQNVERLLIG